MSHAGVRLTPAQRRHLAELQATARDGHTGEAYWMPIGRQQETARALLRHGYLEWVQVGTYALTETGKALDL